MIVWVSVVIIFYNFNRLVCLRIRTLLAMFFFIMNCDVVFRLGIIFTTFASCVWLDFWFNEVQLEWMSKRIGALSVWFYKLVYVYILSMKIWQLEFWRIVTKILKFEYQWGRLGQTFSVCVLRFSMPFVRFVVYKVVPQCSILLWTGTLSLVWGFFWQLLQVVVGRNFERCWVWPEVELG